MKNKILFTATVLTFLFSTMALPADSFTLITDQYWNSMLEKELDNNPLQRFIRDMKEIIPFMSNDKLRTGGHSIDKRVVQIYGDSRDLQNLKNEAALAENEVLLSPIFAVHACETAAEYPDISFNVPAVFIPSDCQEPNIRYYRFDYSDAFFRAGEWAAEQAADVELLFYSAGSTRAAWLESFKNGWNSVRDAEELNITEFGEAEAADNEFTEKLYLKTSDENGISAVFAGPLTEKILSRFDGNGRKLVCMHAAAWTDSGLNCAASIELTPSSIIEQIINYDSIDTYEGELILSAEFFLYDGR